MPRFIRKSHGGLLRAGRAIEAHDRSHPGDDPGRVERAAIFCEDEIVAEVSAGVDGVAFLTQEKERVAIAIGWFDFPVGLDHTAGREASIEEEVICSIVEKIQRRPVAVG